MNVQEYILSGILEAYVLDQLSENERSEVQLMAQTYPEVKDEIEAIEDALHLFAEKTAVTPPQSLKAKLFDELNEESASVEEEKTIGVPKKKDRSFYRFFSIAASVAAIVAIFFSVYYYREWKTAQSKYTDLLAQNQEMAQQFNLTKQKMDQYHDQIQFLTQPGVETVAMKGLDIAPKSLALVHWNKNTHQVLLDVQNLPQTTSDKQYQLWAIVDGKPVDAGLFDVNSTVGSYHKMKKIAHASAFAVTLEPRGGSATPTMDQMYVLGKVSPGT